MPAENTINEAAPAAVPAAGSQPPEAAPTPGQPQTPPPAAVPGQTAAGEAVTGATPAAVPAAGSQPSGASPAPGQPQTPPLAPVPGQAAASPPAQSPVAPAANGQSLAPSPGLPPASPPATGAAPFPPPPASTPELTSTVGVPPAPTGDISVKDMFLNADPVVQGVMLLLMLASLATWVVIFEKTFVLRRVSRSVMLFKKASAQDAPEIQAHDFPPLALPLVEAGLRESGDAAGGETRSDYRERVERSMRAFLSGLMDRVGNRVLFLATVGAVSPFVGLFGTVWGIMHSFIGIAASGETTLAVVAPGIAEALFATAMGLVAAIPAVIAYNKITGTMKKITKEALSGIGFLGNRLARKHFGG